MTLFSIMVVDCKTSQAKGTLDTVKEKSHGNNKWSHPFLSRHKVMGFLAFELKTAPRFEPATRQFEPAATGAGAWNVPA